MYICVCIYKWYIYYYIFIVMEACLIEATVVFKWNKILVIASYITGDLDVKLFWFLLYKKEATISHLPMDKKMLIKFNKVFIDCKVECAVQVV